MNKLNTKATLRLDLAKAKSWLPAHVANNLIRSVSALPYAFQNT